jgi:hypothetical protein
MEDKEGKAMRIKGKERKKMLEKMRSNEEMLLHPKKCKVFGKLNLFQSVGPVIETGSFQQNQITDDSFLLYSMMMEMDPVSETAV